MSFKLVATKIKHVGIFSLLRFSMCLLLIYLSQSYSKSEGPKTDGLQVLFCAIIQETLFSCLANSSDIIYARPNDATQNYGFPVYGDASNRWLLGYSHSKTSA